jgi:glutathione synthase/RimK-type ligase-like ATP-grasp enzyme
MKIVVIASEDDNHTAPLKWALERAGYQVFCWAGPGWSAERQASISILDQWTLCLGSAELEAGDVIWIRRPEPPSLNPGVSEADRKFAQSEYRWFSDSLMYLLELLPVRCINRFSASRTIRNKSVQLLLAQRCGLKVPETLMSNAPPTVRDYLRRGDNDSICKAFFPHIWRSNEDQSVAVTETFRITEAILPADDVLTYAPAIYQQMIDKQYDVRMVLLGASVYSFALHNPKGSIDWRQDVAQGHVRAESVATPEEVRVQVLAFAQQSGIVFGSFDFAVDHDGQWWFLEVNEQGQFLWLDELDPGLHVQEKFLAFLTSPDGVGQDVIEARATLFPSWKEYLASTAATRQVEKQSGAVPECMSLD